MAQSFSLRSILVLFFAFILQVAIAAPTPDALSTSAAADTLNVEARDIVKRYSGTPRGKVGTTGPTSSDYPTDDQIRAAFLNPPGPYVFYSGIGSDTTNPYMFSQNVGGVILRNAFPKKYLNKGSRSQEWLGDFWDRASGIFAEKAPGDVYIVSTYPDGSTIEDCSIWVRMERPTLEANAAVGHITLVDVDDFDNRNQIYTRGTTKRSALPNPLTKRAAPCDGEDIVDGPDA